VWECQPKRRKGEGWWGRSHAIITDTGTYHHVGRGKKGNIHATQGYMKGTQRRVAGFLIETNANGETTEVYGGGCEKGR